MSAMIDSEDYISVEVDEVIYDGGSIATAIGHDVTTGEFIRFAGDWRPMSDLSTGDIAAVPTWAVLTRL